MILPITSVKLYVKQLLPVLLLLCNVSSAMAQYNAPENRIWVFGNNAGLDFNSGNPVAISSSINSGNINGTLEANASVCDSNGALQFYTDGSLVWDRMGNLMPNGQSLTGLGNMNTNSTSQGALIVPMPDSIHKYYVFSLTAVDQLPALRGRLFYSVVDMELSSGMGDVEISRKAVPVDSGLTEKMIGILGDRCNIWVLTCVRGQAKYKAYEITASGVNVLPVISSTGTPKNLSFGYLAVSPDRKRVATSEQALFGGNNGLELARFDAATGIVSGAVQLEPSLGYYGVCFSPDNSKLYGSSFQNVYQFDVNAADPASTKTQICNNGRTSGMQPGPDGKIYFLHTSSLGNKISYIRFPNLQGSSCQAILDTLSLVPNTTMNFGFHNTVPVFTRDTFYTHTTSAAGCFAGNYTIRAADTTGWGYEWNTGATDPRITVTAPGVYWISYHTAPCAYHADSFEVTFPDGFLPQIGMRSNCKGDHNGKAWAYTYNGDTVSYHYVWQNAAGDTLALADTLQNVIAGNYTLHISTAECDTTLPFYMTEEAYHASFDADTLICLGSTITFQNTSDSYFDTFQWRFGDGSNTTLSDPGHLYLQAGSYTVMLAVAGLACKDTAYKHIVVDAPVQDMDFFKDKSSICTGQSILFTPRADSTVVSLYWQLSEGDHLTTTNEAVQHAYDVAGIIPVQMTASFRVCPETDFYDTINVYTPPHVDLGPDSVLCLNSQPVTLSNHAAVLPDAHNLWSTGETTASIAVVHDGRYSLTVTEEHGCAASASVVIRKDCYIDIPNAFTPNGDGSNDYFFPRQSLSGKLTRFRMQVFNRWGQVIFETTNTKGRGWDGRFNGRDQPEGVYLYLITAEINNTHTETYQGNVTLIR